MTALKHIFLLMVFLMPLGCSKNEEIREEQEDVRGGILDVEINDVTGLWILEDGFDRNVKIDNGDEIVIYPLPEEVEVKTILVFEDGDGSIEDWGIEVSPLGENTVGSLSVCDKGIEASGRHVNFVFRTIENGFILDVIMIVDYTKYSLVWKHVASYTRVRR